MLNFICIYWVQEPQNNGDKEVDFCHYCARSRKEWGTISTNELKGNIGNNVQNISEIGTGEAAMS